MTTQDTSNTIPEPSIRGLEEGSSLGPLRKIYGTLAGVSTTSKVYEGQTRYQTVLNLSELEVIQSIEPWHMPIYQVVFGASNRVTSRWGLFAKSLTAIIDAQYSKEQLDPQNAAFVPADKRPNLKQLEGKKIGLVITDGLEGRPQPVMLYDGREKKEKPTLVWLAFDIKGIGVAGAGSDSPSDTAEKLLDGKTLAEFNKDAIANDVIRTDPQLMSAILAPPGVPASFTNVQVAAGKFTKDAQGVFHKV